MKNFLVLCLSLAVMNFAESASADGNCEDFFASTVTAQNLSAKAKDALGPADLKQLKSIAGENMKVDYNNLTGLLKRAYPRFKEDPKLLFSMIYNVPKKIDASAWIPSEMSAKRYYFLNDTLVNRPIKIGPEHFTKQESKDFLRLLLQDLKDHQIKNYLKLRKYDLSEADTQDLYHKYLNTLLAPHLPNLPRGERATWFEKFQDIYINHMSEKSNGPTDPNVIATWFAKLKKRFDIPTEDAVFIKASPDGRSAILSSSVEVPGATDTHVAWETAYSWNELQKLKTQPIEFKSTQMGHEKNLRVRFEQLNSDEAWYKHNPSPSPDYKKMAADGVQRGFITADSGFPKADAEETLGEYIAFFKEKGFKFKKQLVSNTNEYLKNEISNGNIDYVIREGHNALESFAFYRKGTLHVGRKSGHPAQEILILVPEIKNSSAQDKFEWSAVGGWLDQRGKDNPLYFADTKCFSASHICKLLPMVKSANLQLIAPDGIATTFINHPTSPLRALTEGIIERKPYSVIESKMQVARDKAKQYAKKNGEHVSPHEDRYIYPSGSQYGKILKELKADVSRKGTFVLEVEDAPGTYQTLQSFEFQNFDF